MASSGATTQPHDALALKDELMQRNKYAVDVEVTTRYIEDQSEPSAGRYVFAYTVTMTNSGSVGAQLLTRHWIITDAASSVQEVRGEGVVGEKPRLSPGAQYRYTSGTVLATPFGTMRGSYQMLADDGTRFDAEIPAFTLRAQQALH